MSTPAGWKRRHLIWLFLLVALTVAARLFSYGSLGKPFGPSEAQRETPMYPTMVLLMMGRDMRAMEPQEPLFWGVMLLAVIVGFFVAYLVNAWLVAAGLKHGMGTVRALGKGGRWLLHCHIPHHTTNNNVEELGGGGLTMLINVTR